KYNHISLGYNYRMMNLQGAIGRVQLQKLEGFTSRRIANAAVLSREIRAKGLTTPYESQGVRHVYHQYVLRIEDDAPASRERLMQYLESKGIASAVHYPKAVYEQPLYQGLGYEKGICPTAEDVARRVLSLPVHPSLSAEELHYIAMAVNSFEG
ncbi:MAG TPA: DegT/DnrJ/EryC1/StrS family aminotransferase, partial [Methanothrix sp.]|nr:DegT/DnrJ/EryC1/StrS family aminotransferase [Methanothrix sp.]